MLQESDPYTKHQMTVTMTTCVHFVLKKCAEYWPEDTVTHEGMEITLVRVTQEDDYSLRVFTLKVKMQQRITQAVTQRIFVCVFGPSGLTIEVDWLESRRLF